MSGKAQCLSLRTEQWLLRFDPSQNSRARKRKGFSQSTQLSVPLAHPGQLDNIHLISGHIWDTFCGKFKERQRQKQYDWLNEEKMIVWKRKNNRAARGKRMFVHFCDVIYQISTWNFPNLLVSFFVKNGELKQTRSRRQIGRASCRERV